MEAHWVAMYPQVIAQMDGHVLRIRHLISQYDPLELLKHGFWAMSGSMFGKMSEGDYSFEDGVMPWMVDYVQAVIVATPPAPVTVELTNDAWDLLHDEVRAIYELLFLTFHIVNSARLKATQPDYDLDYDGFCVQAQMNATFVRALRYPVHDWEFLHDFLGPHDDELRKLFDVSVVDLVKAIQQIHDSMARDSIAAISDMRDEQHRAIHDLDGMGKPDIDVLLNRIADDPQRRERMDSIYGRLMGLDLFDLERITTLPAKLLDELSLEPGQDTKFFAPGEYVGWPLRVFPTKWRPFLKVKGHHYCFDAVNLMDDIYRAMQRLICRLDPGYVNIWKDRQQEASERRPIELLQELLPGATAYRSLHYPRKSADKLRVEWCELDGLLIYDDLLFVVEIKGGAFTWSPPLTDFPAYLKSVETLLKRPADQAWRFLQYLRGSETIALYDEQHQEIASLSEKSFRVVIPLCITLDALTTAAHQISELKTVGITVSETVCAMAIDDLRIYRDIVPSGVIAAHFLQKRYEAECDPTVHVNDEQDHLGLYLAYLNYVRYARLLKHDFGEEVKCWTGYSRSVDEYYFLSQCDPERAKKPELAVRGYLKEIVKCINGKPLSGLCRCAAILLDFPKETRDDFESVFERGLARSAEEGRPFPFHIQGENSVTVFPYVPQVPRMSFQEQREYTLAWMINADVKNRLLLTVHCDATGRVVDVAWENLSLKDVRTCEQGRLRTLASSHASNRVAAHLRKYGMIGRNELCPCGSGKKYKRCCGRTPPLA